MHCAVRECRFFFPPRERRLCAPASCPTSSNPTFSQPTALSPQPHESDIFFLSFFISVDRRLEPILWLLCTWSTPGARPVLSLVVVAVVKVLPTELQG